LNHKLFFAADLKKVVGLWQRFANCFFATDYADFALPVCCARVTD